MQQEETNYKFQGLFPLKSLCCHDDTWFHLNLTFLKPLANQYIFFFFMEMFFFLYFFFFFSPWTVVLFILFFKIYLFIYFTLQHCIGFAIH